MLKLTWTLYLSVQTNLESLPPPPQESILDDPMELPITPSEISHVLKKLSVGKATGLDNISNEMLKIAGTP